MGAPVQPSFTQVSFQFRNDDGDEFTATWKTDLENVNTDERPYLTFRCRFAISQTVSNANANLTRAFKLRYSLNGGTYTDVGAQNSQTIIRYANSSNVSDGTETTNLLLISQNTFVPGRIDDNGDTGNITFPSGQLSFTEIEFVLELYGAAINQTDDLDLRVYQTNNTVLATYTNTARIKRRRRLRVLG